MHHAASRPLSRRCPAPALRPSWGTSSANHAPAADRPAACSVHRRPSRPPIRLPHRHTHPTSSSALPRSAPRRRPTTRFCLSSGRKKTNKKRTAVGPLEGPAFQPTPPFLSQFPFSPHHHSTAQVSCPPLPALRRPLRAAASPALPPSSTSRTQPPPARRLLRRSRPFAPHHH
jgi:hypothetical protein